MCVWRSGPSEWFAAEMGVVAVAEIVPSDFSVFLKDADEQADFLEVLFEVAKVWCCGAMVFAAWEVAGFDVLHSASGVVTQPVEVLVIGLVALKGFVPHTVFVVWVEERWLSFFLGSRCSWQCTGYGFTVKAIGFREVKFCTDAICHAGLGLPGQRAF